MVIGRCRDYAWKDNIQDAFPEIQKKVVRIRDFSGLLSALDISNEY